MQIIFIDESGYTPDWRIYDPQPFYVLTAICLPADSLPELYSTLRAKVASFDFLGDDVKPLGQGFEIKAKDIAKGTGWWRDREAERNEVRDAFLGVPCQSNGVGILVVTDKQKHQEKYITPFDPYQLSLKYTLERLQKHLVKIDDYGVIVYDCNIRLSDKIQRQACDLFRDGSSVEFFHWYYQQQVERNVELDRLLDFTMGTSHNSIGLQVADFYATMCYQYFKNGKPNPCGWWDSLTHCIDRNEKDQFEGYGLKLIP